MKLLITTGLYPPEIGGPATYTKLMESELPKYGIEVTVLPFSRVRQYPKLVRHVLYAFLVFKAARSVDVVFAQDTVSVGIPTFCATRFSQAKFLIRVPGDYAWEQAVQRFGVTDSIDAFQEKRYSWRVEVLRSLQALVTKRADRVIVPSEYLQKIVSGWIDEDASSAMVVVIYNVVLPHDLPQPSSNGRKQLILTASRLVPWKGQRELITVFESIAVDHPDYQLCIVGEGPERSALEQLVSERELTNNVRFTGALNRSALYELIGSAEVFVLNTSYEGLSHQLLEVMTIGTPIVTTEVGGNPELITDRESGLLVPPHAPEKLESAIRELLENWSLREKCIQNARQNVTRFKFSAEIKKLADIIHGT